MSDSNFSNEAHPFTPDKTMTAVQVDIPIPLIHIPPMMDAPAYTIPPQYFMPIQEIEGLFSFSLSDPRETFSSMLDTNFSNEAHPFTSDETAADIPIRPTSLPPRSNKQPTNRPRPPKRRYYSCDLCGQSYARPQELTRHHREKHQISTCVYCDDFRWGNSYQYRKHLKERHPSATRMSCLYCDFDFDKSPRHMYRDHLEKHHPDVDPTVALDPANHIRRLCMYCDVQWFHSGQSYKDHLKEHHPNLDPDAVLGEVSGSQRRDKIICKIQYIKARVSTQDHKIGRTSAPFTWEFGDEAREVIGGNSLAGT